MSKEQDKKQEVKEEPSKENLNDEEVSGLSGGKEISDGLSRTFGIIGGLNPIIGHNPE